MLANDVLQNKVPTGVKVLVAIGGMIGAEVAEYLCDYNKEVTVVEHREAIGLDINPIVKINVMKRLRSLPNLHTLCSFIIEEIA